MQDRIYTLKKGTEVPAQFDGVTIPFSIPSTLAEVQTVCNGDEKTLVAIFNQAHALNVQKDAKSVAMEEGATVESIRKAAAEFKYGTVRVRGASTGAAKPSAAKVEAALGADFLAMLTPEQKALYDQRIAALKVKPAEPAATEAAAPAEAAPAAEQPKNGNQKRK